MRISVPRIAGRTPVTVGADHAEAKRHAVRFAGEYCKLISQTRDYGSFGFVLGRQRLRRAAVDRRAAQTEYILDRDRQALCGSEIGAGFECSIRCLRLCAGCRTEPELVCIQRIAVLPMPLLRFVEQICGAGGAVAKSGNELECRAGENADVQAAPSA